MKKESLLKQEYKNLKCQTTPELWSRIERNLKEHPERNVTALQEIPTSKPAPPPKADRWWMYTTAAVAAVFLLIVSATWSLNLIRFSPARSLSSEEQEAGTLSEETAFAQGQWNMENLPITTSDVPSPPQGVLYYSQLDLGSRPSLSLPSKAVTIPEDTMYFSEELLADTQLLCLGTVTKVSLETEKSRGAVALVYEVTVNSLCYSADYVTDLTHLTIKSPIVSAQGKENQILYQLLEGETYLLPLKKQTGDWELLFPFAPQVQLTGEGAYVFHSGYNSLIDDQTFVVVKEQEGDNDFYYDRMLLRNDDGFLSDYISLIMR